MEFNFNARSVTLLFFFLQGFVFSAILFIKGSELGSLSGRWLSFFVFLCTLSLCPWMFGYAGWYGIEGYREALFFIPTQHYFLLGPIIYYYSKILMAPAFKFSKTDFLHFIPGLLYILFSVVAFVSDALILNEFYFYASGRDLDLNPVHQFVGTAWVLVYLLISIHLYYTYRQIIVNEFSFADTISYGWLKRFLLVLSVIMMARIIFLLIYPDWGNFGAKFWYYVIFSVLFYYIALTGLMNTIRLSVPFALLKDQPGPLEEHPVRSIEDLDEWKEKLSNRLVQKALFRNPLLTLTDIADEMSISRRQVSAIINQGFGMNFNDYVNSFRIDEIKNRFANGEAEDFTVLGIALEAGFNSKTTFNRAFKKYTGSTPKSYLQKLGF